jgi:hypothetical protein
MKATRQIEYVCFFPIEIPTKQGDIYVFSFVDAYSKFYFHTGTETSNNNDNILKHIKLLMDHREFKMHRDKGFTLVFHKDHDIQKEIEAIIKPYAGKMIIDDLMVAQELTPVVKHLYESMSKQFPK